MSRRRDFPYVLSEHKVRTPAGVTPDDAILYDNFVVIDPRDAAKSARDLREAIGAQPGDTIVVQTPVFERSPLRPPPAPAPVSRAGFDALKTLSIAELLAVGLRQWDAPKRGVALFLFPGEWYDAIPPGYPVTTINGETRPHEREPGRDDRRHGCLAYGVLVPVKS